MWELHFNSSAANLYKKTQQTTTKKHEKLPNMQRVKTIILLLTLYSIGYF